jgi:hypothetical protein
MNFLDRVPEIPDFTPIFDLIREKRILSAILGYRVPLAFESDMRSA